MVGSSAVLANYKQWVGDEGLEGIRRFCKQHKCNSICHGLNLPTLSTIELGRTTESKLSMYIFYTKQSDHETLESRAVDSLDTNLEDGEIADTQAAVSGASGSNNVESLEI